MKPPARERVQPESVCQSERGRGGGSCGRRSQLSVTQGPVIYPTEDERIISVSLTHYTPALQAGTENRRVDGWSGRRGPKEMVGWVARSETRREPLADCYIISQSAFETNVVGFGILEGQKTRVQRARLSQNESLVFPKNTSDSVINLLTATRCCWVISLC